jgi:Bacterial PH domain
VFGVITIVVLGVVFAVAAAYGAGAYALLPFLGFSGIILLPWLTTRGLTRSTFAIDAGGMEVRTPGKNRRVTWPDVDSATVVAEDGRHLLCATLRPGIEPPLPTSLGFPWWSSQRRCLIVMRVESFDTTPAEVTEALRRYGGGTFRADGRL